MSVWVISSNPTSYDAIGALTEDREMDWIANKKFMIGDTVYIYEVVPPRGRGGIVYETEVTETNIRFKDKIDDRKRWQGQAYPASITEQSKFSRLKYIGEPAGGVILLKTLREFGFAPLQRGDAAASVTESLKTYIELSFQNIHDSEIEEVAKQINLAGSLEEVTKFLEELTDSMPPIKVRQVIQKIVRNPKKAQLIKESKQYICEVCEIDPFIQKSGKPYAEADHIIPLGGKYKGLDNLKNMRCLCAQCHAVITHGSDGTVRELLRSTKWQS